MNIFAGPQIDDPELTEEQLEIVKNMDKTIDEQLEIINSLKKKLRKVFYKENLEFIKEITFLENLKNKRAQFLTKIQDHYIFNTTSFNLKTAVHLNTIDPDLLKIETTNDKVFEFLRDLNEMFSHDD